MFTPRWRRFERLQHLEADAHLFLGLGRERNADRVADPRPQQRAHADRRFHRAGACAASLGDADMQWVVAGVGKLLISRDREENVGRLHADLEFVEVVVLQDARVVERRLDHRLRAGLAVFLQQVLLERAGIDADAHRHAVVPGRFHHLAHPLGAADIAGVDAQASRTRIGRFDGALIVEVDVGHDRHAGRLDDLVQRLRRILVGAGNPDDVDARFFAAADLLDRRVGVGGQRVGHRLHGDRRITTHRHGPDHDLPRLAAHDVAIGTNAHGPHFTRGFACYPSLKDYRTMTVKNVSALR